MGESTDFLWGKTLPWHCLRTGAIDALGMKVKVWTRALAGCGISGPGLPGSTSAGGKKEAGPAQFDDEING